jgi:hypothetical protein
MAWLLNLLLPGTGLILRRREWLGFLVAVVFGLLGNLALAGLLIAPEALPGWLIRSALGGAGLVWISAQAMLWRQGVLAAARARGLELILQQARAALAAHDAEGARLCLESGLALDDESVEVHVLWARLFTIEGDDSGRQRAWRRVLELDLRRVYRAEAIAALGPRR